MFHTYVTNSYGNPVDFDRASFLMDKDLLQEALDAIPESQPNRPRVVWGYYCAAHMRRYGKPFVCDSDPYWDRDRPLLVRVFSSDRPLPILREMKIRRPRKT